MPRPTFHADLHIHSKYSRACSRDCDLEHLTWYAKRKGLTLVGTGDFTHPAWNAHLHETLVEAEPGLYRLNDDLEKSVNKTLPGIVAASTVRFMLSVEISTIYKRGDKTRKVHHLVYLPDLEAVGRFNARLARIGNIASDGRPILGLDSRDLLEITLEASPDGYLVPAHIWTPWFAALGSKSGFDAIADCYVDLADHIFAVETGLSSDPAMNWRVSSLDQYTLVSNSDAHSPPALAREAHSYTCELDYFAVREALRTGDGYAGSIEFFPEEGKYHADGHRACNLSWQPAETIAAGGKCAVCGKPVTVGVLSRVEALADRPDGQRPDGKANFRNLVPLPEIVGEIHSVGPRSKTVTREIDSLVAALGPELDILTEIPVDQVTAVGGELLGEAITRLRRGDVIRRPGYDGEYGVIRLFEPAELKASTGASALFDLPTQDDYAVRRTAAAQATDRANTVAPRTAGTTARANAETAALAGPTAGTCAETAARAGTAAGASADAAALMGATAGSAAPTGAPTGTNLEAAALAGTAAGTSAETAARTGSTAGTNAAALMGATAGTGARTAAAAGTNAEVAAAGSTAGASAETVALAGTTAGLNGETAARAGAAAGASADAAALMGATAGSAALAGASAGTNAEGAASAGTTAGMSAEGAAPAGATAGTSVETAALAGTSAGTNAETAAQVAPTARPSADAAARAGSAAGAGAAGAALARTAAGASPGLGAVRSRTTARGGGRRSAAVGRTADPAALVAHQRAEPVELFHVEPTDAVAAPPRRTGPGKQRTAADSLTTAREHEDATGPATHGGASYGGQPDDHADGSAAGDPAGVDILPFEVPDWGVLEGLDPEQRAAAGAADGPLLVVAGPGTGKTRTLTHRVAYLVAERGVAAESCLAITFTRRAAGELAERLAGLLPVGSGEPFVATFHALALTICREQFAALGFEEPPSVADEADQAEVLAELGLSADAELPDEYRKRLRARGLLELDELVPLAVPFAAEYRSRWPHVLVDEYQDVDADQYALLRELVPTDGNLFAIGDPDQSIYSFRGADVGFFLRFASDYPSATTVTLTRNYRSAPPIVATAVQVVRPGTLVPGRGLSAERRDLGAARIAVHSVSTEAEEAGWVAATIDALVGGASFHSLDSGRVDGSFEVEEHYGFGDVAVLYRSAAQARAVQSALTSAGLPFQKRGVDRLADRPGVPAVLREMALLPGSVPVRLREAGSVLASRASAPDLFSVEDVTLRASDVWAAVELLRPVAAAFESDLDGFLAYVATGAEVDALDPRADAVSLLTLHAAKGLEFPVVFVVGCADGVVPLRFPGETDPEERLAEERRLFFVGVTRAQRRLFLSAPRQVTRRGSTVQAALTPFLGPVDEGLLDRTGSEEGPRRPAVRQMRLI